MKQTNSINWVRKRTQAHAQGHACHNIMTKRVQPLRSACACVSTPTTNWFAPESEILCTHVFLFYVAVRQYYYCCYINFITCVCVRAYVGMPCLLHSCCVIKDQDPPIIHAYLLLLLKYSNIASIYNDFSTSIECIHVLTAVVNGKDKRRGRRAVPLLLYTSRDTSCTTRRGPLGYGGVHKRTFSPSARPDCPATGDRRSRGNDANKCINTFIMVMCTCK